jgi:hypothetical protein
MVTTLISIVPARALLLPTITEMKITKAGTSGTTWKIALTGSNLGTAPVSLPCRRCAIRALQVIDMTDISHAEAVNILTWTDKTITLSGVQGAAGEGVLVAVKNRALKNVATRGGHFPTTAVVPTISRVEFSGAGQPLAITVTGTGFGPAPSGIPGKVNVPYFEFVDWNIKRPNSEDFPWNAGYDGQGFIDGVTLNYVSWSDKKIVIHGFTGRYGDNGWSSRSGDPYAILLWQVPGVTAGQTGPQTAKAGRLP